MHVIKTYRTARNYTSRKASAPQTFTLCKKNNQLLWHQS